MVTHMDVVGMDIGLGILVGLLDYFGMCITLPNLFVLCWLLIHWQPSANFPVEHEFSWGFSSGAVGGCPVMTEIFVQFLFEAVLFCPSGMPDLLDHLHEIHGQAVGLRIFWGYHCMFHSSPFHVHLEVMGVCTIEGWSSIRFDSVREAVGGKHTVHMGNNCRSTGAVDDFYLWISGVFIDDD